MFCAALSFAASQPQICPLTVKSFSVPPMPTSMLQVWAMLLEQTFPLTCSPLALRVKFTLRLEPCELTRPANLTGVGAFSVTPSLEQLLKPSSNAMSAVKSLVPQLTAKSMLPESETVPPPEQLAGVVMKEQKTFFDPVPLPHVSLHETALLTTSVRAWRTDCDSIAERIRSWSAGDRVGALIPRSADTNALETVTVAAPADTGSPLLPLPQAAASVQIAPPNTRMDRMALPSGMALVGRRAIFRQELRRVSRARGGPLILQQRLDLGG